MGLKDIFSKDKESEIKYATFSNIGERPLNEDSVGFFEKGDIKMFVLADGLGGHGKGDEASKLAVNTCGEMLEKYDNIIDIMSYGFRESEERILKVQEETRNTNAMKTTLVIAIIQGNQLYYGYIGDSRFYYFKNKRYTFRTLDHSVPQMLASSGEIKESDIRHHEDRNRLLRVIGIEWDDDRFELGKASVTVKHGDSILLCSDGFWELLLEKDMEKTLKKASNPEEWIRSMDEIIVANGKGTNMDNYSCVCAMI